MWRRCRYATRDCRRDRACSEHGSHRQGRHLSGGAVGHRHGGAGQNRYRHVWRAASPLGLSRGWRFSPPADRSRRHRRKPLGASNRSRDHDLCGTTTHQDPGAERVLLSTGPRRSRDLWRRSRFASEQASSSPPAGCRTSRSRSARRRWCSSRSATDIWAGLPWPTRRARKPSARLARCGPWA